MRVTPKRWSSRAPKMTKMVQRRPPASRAPRRATWPKWGMRRVSGCMTASRGTATGGPWDRGMGGKADSPEFSVVSSMTVSDRGASGTGTSDMGPRRNWGHCIRRTRRAGMPNPGNGWSVGLGSAGARGLAEELADFAVSGLGEVVVPLADRIQPGGHEEADNLVGLLGEPLTNRGGCDRDGDNDAGRVALAEGGDGGTHGGTGGESVVDQNDGAAGDFDGQP